MSRLSDQFQYNDAKKNKGMALNLKQIKKPIDAELNIFEKRFRESMRSKAPLLDKVMYYIVQHKGKQMRPMFVFFSAKVNGKVGEATYRGAALIELLHTATLVHDDVVDDSNKRRGFFSVNALWKNKIAVLVGDYLLSKGLLLSLENKDYQLLHIVSNAVKEMSEGELLQIEKARKLDIDEAVYYEIIRQKTATLIASACGVGYASARPDDEAGLEQILLFGEKVGIAFQIRDDLFDYGSDNIGKPTGIDIKEKKMTLPLIYALNQASKSDRRHIIYLVKNKNLDKKAVREVIDFVHQSKGMEYATEAMFKYQKDAFDILHQFPPSDARTGLEQLVRFTTERKK